MKKLLTAIATTLITANTWAHHSDAGIDMESIVAFEGTVTEFHYRNPHVYVLVDVETETGDIVEWVLHLPARGSAYVRMQAQPVEGGYRIGSLMSGTREYEPLTGGVTERWVEDTSGIEDAPQGRIEIITAFVSREFEDE